MRVAVAGGGTGGHFFPALSVIEKLKQEGCDVLYVGAENGIEFKLKDVIDTDSLFVNVKGIRGKGLFEAMKNSFLMSKAITEVLSHVISFNPEVVAVFGGYTSLPLGLSAIILRKRLIIHEQNSVPGKTNLLLSRFAEKVLIGSKYAEKYFRDARFVGNPIRDGFFKFNLTKEQALKRFSLDEGKFTVLVFGGSQGSKRINEVVIELLDDIRDLNGSIQFIHIAGYDNLELIKSAYAERGFKAYVDSFVQDLWSAYMVCDVAISRSGAISLAELCYFGIPTIFIPYPFAVDNHQYFNVKPIYDLEGCFLIREKELTVDSISQAVKSLYEDSRLREKFSSVMKSFSIRNSADLIVEEIING